MRTIYKYPAYPAAITAWNVGAAKALHKLADRLNGKPVEGMGRSYHGELTVPITLPEMPQKPTLDCRVDRYIKVVELVDAKTFRLRTDDPIFAVVLPNRC